MMKSFFEALQWLFDNIVLALHGFLRSLELSNWWLANIVSWGFIIVCCYYAVYWTKQLQSHKDNNEENQDTTAHSFLK
jgi:arginine exporter protein ArgO